MTVIEGRVTVTSGIWGNIILSRGILMVGIPNPKAALGNEGSDILGIGIVGSVGKLIVGIPIDGKVGKLKDGNVGSAGREGSEGRLNENPLLAPLDERKLGSLMVGKLIAGRAICGRLGRLTVGIPIGGSEGSENAGKDGSAGKLGSAGNLNALIKKLGSSNFGKAILGRLIEGKRASRNPTTANGLMMGIMGIGMRIIDSLTSFGP